MALISSDDHNGLCPALLAKRTFVWTSYSWKRLAAGDQRKGTIGIWLQPDLHLRWMIQRIFINSSLVLIKSWTLFFSLWRREKLVRPQILIANRQHLSWRLNVFAGLSIRHPRPFHRLAKSDRAVRQESSGSSARPSQSQAGHLSSNVVADERL